MRQKSTKFSFVVSVNATEVHKNEALGSVHLLEGYTMQNKNQLFSNEECFITLTYLT